MKRNISILLIMILLLSGCNNKNTNNNNGNNGNNDKNKTYLKEDTYYMYQNGNIKKELLLRKDGTLFFAKCDYSCEVSSGTYSVNDNSIEVIIDKAYERGMQIFLNPSPYDAYLDACDMSKVSCFFMNEIEGGLISGGETDPDKIIEKVLEKYPDARIVLTLGGDGSIYADKNERHHQEIFKVETVDTTAAGDTFTGYFIAGIINGTPIKETLRMSALAASITVSRPGATPSIPYMEEVQKML